MPQGCAVVFDALVPFEVGCRCTEPLFVAKLESPGFGFQRRSASVIYAGRDLAGIEIKLHFRPFSGDYHMFF
ncbi:MAG: hypothetical protein CMJ80_15535 [Planctomycetaceae bacterium]|nr:hypothetical protein [Planctomycetaceae bacterium]